MAATVSVIIPTFNCAAFLAEAIRSVQAQTCPVHQIIVVDDGSTDDTPALMAGWSAEVTCLRQTNAGVAVARNAGLRAVTGDRIAFLDADDFWEPDKLAVQMAALDVCPHVDLVCSDFSLVNDRGELRQARYVKDRYRVFRAHGLDWPQIFHSRIELPHAGGTVVWFGPAFRTLFLGNFINTSSVVMRRRALDRVGLFTPGRQTQEDYEYWLKIADGSALAYVDRPLLALRRRDGQLTAADQRVRGAENALAVVESIAPRARAAMAERLVSRRLSERCVALAVARLDAAERGEARLALRKAFAYRPTSLAAAIVLVWSWLPPGLADRLRKLFRPIAKALIPT